MKNHLFFELFNTFSKKELRQFKKFVRSPFVTHRTDMELMFNFITDTKNEGKPHPSKEIIFKKTFPDESFDDLKYRNTMSDLRELMEEYLLWAYLKEDKWKAQLKLAAIFRQRNLPKHFSRTMKKATQSQKKQATKNLDYFQNILDSQAEQLQFKTQSKRTDELNLQEISDTHDILYLSQKLRHACTQLSHQAVFSKEYNYGLLPYLIEIIEKEGLLNIPAVAIYYYAYRFMTEAYSLIYFQKFKNSLFEHGSLFPENEVKDLYLSAINFCIRKVNEGEDTFSTEVWELFEKGLKTEVLLENNRLSRFTFNNIVAAGIKITAFDRVKEFISTYREKLEPEYQESTVNFNFARLEFSKKNYKEALFLLQTADFKDLVNNLIAKTMLLKIYYELKEFDLLEAHLDSFSVFIRRRDASKFHKTNYLNIIKTVRKLIRINPFVPTEKEALRKQIEETEILTERVWLVAQLE